MNYIVLDLEWNQYTSEKDRQSKGIPFEIVEMGAIKLDENKNMAGEFSRIIKPQIYEKIHYMTKKIVNIGKEDLAKGDFFPSVAKEFLHWCGQDYIFCTWGSLDLTELQRNMSYYKMGEISGGPVKYLDIQKLFSLSYEDGKSRRTLEYAVDYLHIEKDIPFHRAYGDAYYTAKIFKEFNKPSIEEKFSFDAYITPKSKKEEIHITFDSYSKFISREFKSKTDAMEDKEVNSTKCYLCGKIARKKLRWFSVNGKHYYCVAYCQEHGFLKGKARIKKAENGDIYIVKTLKLISEEETVKIKEKKDKLRVHRADKRKHKK